MVLKADYNALGNVASQLKGIKDDFDGAEDRFRGHRDATGDGDINDALHRFATKWSDKRGEIGERMTEVAGYAQTASTTYRGTDHGLGNDIGGLA